VQSADGTVDGGAKVVVPLPPPPPMGAAAMKLYSLLGSPASALSSQMQPCSSHSLEKTTSGEVPGGNLR
jgi:hypothetical protein